MRRSTMLSFPFQLGLLAETILIIAVMGPTYLNFDLKKFISSFLETLLDWYSPDNLQTS